MITEMSAKITNDCAVPATRKEADSSRKAKVQVLSAPQCCRHRGREEGKTLWIIR